MRNVNRTIWVLIFFLFVAATAFGQNDIEDDFVGYKATPENFARVMQMKNPSEAQFDTIWVLAKLYRRVSEDTFKVLSVYAADVTKNSENKVLAGRGLYLKGVYYATDSLGLECLLKASRILKDAGDINHHSLAEKAIGTHYQNRNDPQMALHYFLSALNVLKPGKDSIRMIAPLMAIGGVYFSMGNLEKAQAYMSEVIELTKTVGKKEDLPPILTNQAKIFLRLGAKFESMADTASAGANLYRDSATVYYQKGLDGANEALALSQELNNRMGILASLIAIAEVKNSLGQYEEAIETGKEALLKAEKVGILDFIAKCHLVLATSHRKMGDFKQALHFAKTGYELIQTKTNYPSTGNFESELYEIYKGLGMPLEALQMLEKMRVSEAKQYSLDTKKAIADAETKYQTAEKEKEILELAIANEKVSKQRNYLLMGGIVLGLFGFFGYRFNKVEKDRNDKKAFAEALIFAQEEERKRIGRDLHDGIGQSLLMIKKVMDNTAGVTLENQQMITTTLEEVRAISHDLHPFQLDKFGLTATLSDMVLKVEQSTNLFVTREIADIDQVLDAKSEIHLYRVVQEALSNIVKHAEATAAKVSVQKMADKIMVSILDNGKGFDLELAVATSKSLGIRTMHERISAIGGKLNIEKGETSGTHIHISIPIKSPSASRT